MQNYNLKSENQIPALSAIKNDLLIFNNGFQHFQSMELQDGFIIYQLPNYQRAAEARVKAEQRINEMGLRLLAVGTGKLSNTFVVRVKEVVNV